MVGECGKDGRSADPKIPFKYKPAGEKFQEDHRSSEKIKVQFNKNLTIIF
jgi:hypothetical protein